MGDSQHGGTEQQEAVMKQCSVAEPLPPWCGAVLRCECAANTLLQVTVGNARGACRFASAALHAGLHEVHELVGDRRLFQMHLADGCDATTR